MSDSEILVLGKIQGARGIRGDLRIIRRGDMLDSLKKNSKVEVYSAQGIKDGFLVAPEYAGEYVLQNFSVLAVDTAQVRFKELANAEDAVKLKGLFIGIKLSEAKKKFHNHDDPYLFEYLHCLIFEGDGIKGRVKRVEEYNHKQWLIGDCNETEVMIPLQGPFIKKIDLSQEKIFLIEDSGLF